MSQMSLAAGLPDDVIIHTDGGSRGNPGPAGIGVVVLRDGVEIFSVGKCIGQGTNNEAEYLAFAESLTWLLENQSRVQPKKVTWKLDSMLVVQQLQKNWKIKEPRMLSFAQKIWIDLTKLAVPYQILHIPRAENAAADLLVNQALDEAN